MASLLSRRWRRPCSCFLPDDSNNNSCVSFCFLCAHATTTR
jgi:hypothetical protein